MITRQDGAFIPEDLSNADYREYLAWIEEGNTPGIVGPEPIVAEISTDSAIIIGDGVDETILTVRGEPNTTVTINTLCGITAGSINIQIGADGNGSQAFSCDTSPCVIVFSAGESSCKVRTL
jgi:hypothetical protein